MADTRPHSRIYGRHDGLLDAQCWCGRSIIPTEPAEVRYGRAPSCGPHCRPTTRPPLAVKERERRRVRKHG